MEDDITVIDIRGPLGNAFYLLGLASKLAKEEGLDGKAIMDDMKKGDYDHLLEVFETHFGDKVILIR